MVKSNQNVFLQMYSGVSGVSRENHCCLVSPRHHHRNQDNMSNGLHQHSLFFDGNADVSSHDGFDVQYEEED